MEREGHILKWSNSLAFLWKDGAQLEKLLQSEQSVFVVYFANVGRLASDE